MLGVSSSPILLTGILIHHLTTFLSIDPDLVHKVLKSLHVDDLCNGDASIQSAYNVHMKCKDRLLQAKFTLHLFELDSPEQMINEKVHELFITKIVGLQWDKIYDTVIFDMKKLKTLMIIKPTIRKFIQFFAAIYDLLGLSNPFVVSFVLFVLVFQKSCITKANWDAILSQDILKVWHNIILDLRIIIVLRWYGNLKSAKRVELHGFSDASISAYGCCICIGITGQDG